MSLRQLHNLLWSRLVWFGILLLGGLTVAVVGGRLENQTTSALYNAGQELFFARPVEAASNNQAQMRAAAARQRAEARKRAAAARKRAAAERKRAAAERKRAAAAERKRAAAARKRAAAARKRAAAKKNKTSNSANKKNQPSDARETATRTDQSQTPEPTTAEASTDPQPTTDDTQQTENSAQRDAPALRAPEVPRTLVGVFERLSKPTAKPAPVTRRTSRPKQSDAGQATRAPVATRRVAPASTLQRQTNTAAPSPSLDRNQPAASATEESRELPWAKAKRVRRHSGLGLQSIAPSQKARQSARQRSLSDARRERRRRAAARRLADFRTLPAHNFGSSRDTVRNEILVERLNPALLKRAAALGFKPLDTTSGTDTNVVRLRAPTGSNTQTAFKMLSNLFASGSVHFNRRYRLYHAAQGGDWHTTLQAKEKQQCSSERCYGPAAVRWRNHLSRCAQGLRIGIVDTAIATRHPAFAGQQITTARIASGPAPRHNNGHGTGILALLAGSPGSSTPGLVPDASFFATDIFFRDAQGNTTSDSLTLHKALLKMEAWGVQVINLSLAGPPDSLVEKTIHRLSRKGVMFVAAGGNEGPSAAPSYPAAYPEVIAVTAVDRSLRGYRYANRGDYIDVAAPGVNIWTAAPNDKDALLSGTSLAAPFVTSIVSAVYRALPNKSRQGLLDAIATQDLGRPGKDQVFGQGLVRAPASCRPRLKASPQVARATGRDLAAAIFNSIVTD